MTQKNEIAILKKALKLMVDATGDCSCCRFDCDAPKNGDWYTVCINRHIKETKKRNAVIRFEVVK